MGESMKIDENVDDEIGKRGKLVEVEEEKDKVW